MSLRGNQDHTSRKADCSFIVAKTGRKAENIIIKEVEIEIQPRRLTSSLGRKSLSKKAMSYHNTIRNSSIGSCDSKSSKDDYKWLNHGLKVNHIKTTAFEPKEALVRIHAIDVSQRRGH